jgi:hypothetical protein
MQRGTSLTCSFLCSFVFTLEEFVRELVTLIQAMVDVGIGKVSADIEVNVCHVPPQLLDGTTLSRLPSVLRWLKKGRLQVTDSQSQRKQSIRHRVGKNVPRSRQLSF